MLLLLVALACWSFPQQVLTVDSGPVKADVIIILGGGLERAHRGAELFNEGEAPLVLCTGEGDGDSYRAVLIKAGVPKQGILLETDSSSTRQNAQFSAPILESHHIKSAIIVTTWFHSRRALRCFEHYVPGIKFYSRPSYFGFRDADSNRKHISGYIRIEYVKLVGYWVCYGVCPF